MIGLGPRRTSVDITRLTRWRAQKRVARGLFVAVFGGVAAFAFAPWQQNAVGTGKVIAYSPNERELELQAPVDGRVVEWYFQEGDTIEEGEVVVQLADNDPHVLERYRAQRDAKRLVVATAEERIERVESQLRSLEKSRALTLAAASADIRAATNDVEVAAMGLEAAQAKAAAARVQRGRMRSLAKEGLASERDLDVALRNADRAVANVRSAEAKLQSRRAAVGAKRARRSSKAAALDADIASAEQDLQSARGKLADATSSLADAERALARQDSLEVRAPRSGMLLRVDAREGSDYVSQGDKLGVVVPDTQRRAAELYVAGNDAPLVVEGEDVRLQFEGWPAIQLGGWPEAAVGTFHGRVAFVDAKVSQNGRFRVVVEPAADSTWPSSNVLRQGNDVHGWILLREVPLGYEIWRQLNGFPPDLPKKAADSADLASR